MSKKTDQIKFMQAMFPNTKFVECKYIEEGQRVADDSKTIDHISQEEKKVSLTEQWKKGELEVDRDYYLKFADGSIDIQKYIGGFLMRADNEVVEVLGEVPEYTIWRNYVNGYCEEHEYNLQLIEENQKLKELLKECRDDVYNYQYICLSTLTKIDEVLK